jgi:hypothetical protein
MLVTASLACLNRNRDNVLVGESRKRVQEIIADNLSKAGWSLGWVSAIAPEGLTIWIVDAHRGDGKRFVVRADEKLTAFVEPNRCRCFSRRESFSLQNGYQFVPLDARDPELTFTKTIL